MKSLLIIISIICINNIAYAQWTSNSMQNTAICADSAKQADPRILSTANGGAFIAWKDWRNGTSNPDIYLQKVNAKGEILWAINGINLCNNSSDQSTPNLTEDMSGGVIVAWSDWRSGVERDLYAQRVDSNGVIKWNTNGNPVTTKNNREHNEKIISDGAGGAIIIWEQQSAGKWDVWGQCLDSNGSPKWLIGGVPLCIIAGNRLNPKVQSDKAGGAIVVWQDERIVGNYDIYAQRINASGQLLWGNTAKKIGGGNGNQIDPKIDPDPTVKGVYVSWIDKRNTIDYDIYAQRLDSNGTALWATNGMPVVTSVGNQSAQDMLSNALVNGLIITWKDARNGYYDIYAQKLNTNGTPMWGTNGIVINNDNFDQLNPNICADDNGGAIIVFQDSTASIYDIKAQRIDSMGSILWPATGVVVSDAVNKQVGPKNCGDGNSGSIIVWEDDRVSKLDRNIYAQRIDKNGTNFPLQLQANMGNIFLDIFPNSCTNSFTIRNSNNLQLNYLIMLDALGKRVDAQFTSTNSGDIIGNISSLAIGNYTLQYCAKDGKSMCYQLQKSK